MNNTCVDMTEMKSNYILGLMKLYSYCLQIAGLKRTQASVVDSSLDFLTRIFCEKILFWLFWSHSSNPVVACDNYFN